MIRLRLLVGVDSVLKLFCPLRVLHMYYQQCRLILQVVVFVVLTKAFTVLRSLGKYSLALFDRVLFRDIIDD